MACWRNLGVNCRAVEPKSKSRNVIDDEVVLTGTHNDYQRYWVAVRLIPFVGVLVLLAGLGGGCATRAAKSCDPPPQRRQAETILVLHRGMHTGIVVPAADIPAGLWPEHKQFPQAEYLEVGWGDTQGYRFPLTTPIALRALFASKGSVMLIHAFSGSITNEYVDVAKEIIAVQLSESGFARLCRYIQDAYALDRQGRPVPLPSNYSGENFFRAIGHYSMINNCNNWTARALRSAGCPVHPRTSLLPGIVMHQVRRFGHIIWPPRRTDKPASKQTDLVLSWSSNRLH